MRITICVVFKFVEAVMHHDNYREGMRERTKGERVHRNHDEVGVSFSRVA